MASNVRGTNDFIREESASYADDEVDVEGDNIHCAPNNLLQLPELNEVPTKMKCFTAEKAKEFGFNGKTGSEGRWDSSKFVA